MAKTGRKGSVSEDNIAKLEEAFRMGVNVQEACFYAIISTDAYYRKYNIDRSFRNRIESAKRFLYITSKKNISQKILDGNVELSKWFLEKKDFDYQNTPTPKVSMVNNNGSEENPIGESETSAQETLKRIMAKYGKRFVAMSR